METEQRVQLFCKVDEQQTLGFAIRRDLSTSERLVRALRIFAICLGVGLLTVFIPVLHFVLPPLFLLAGLFLAFNEFMARGQVLRGEIQCPNCQTQLVLARETESWPRQIRCTHCYYTLLLQRSML